MLAGHITLKVFAGSVTMLGALGALGIVGAIVPLALTIALTALETPVAVLQPTSSPFSPAFTSTMHYIGVIERYLAKLKGAAAPVIRSMTAKPGRCWLSTGAARPLQCRESGATAVTQR